MRTTLVLYAMLGAGLIAVDADAHPSLLRWSFEAVITNTTGNTSAPFPGMRTGDDLRGTLAYDRTAAGTVFPIDPDFPNERLAYYELAPSFELASIVFENPRTGGVVKYLPEENGGIDVWDEFDRPPYDTIWMQQYFYSPSAPESPEIVANFQFYGDSLDGTDLPLNLQLDDWAGVTIFLRHIRIGGATLTAEIGLLTPIDVPFVPGDFNGDGAVDAADLSLWTWANGSIDANLAADANGDSRVDGADFLIWQRQLGSETAQTAAEFVPEPAAVGMALVVACAVAWARRRRVAARLPAAAGAR